VKVGLVQAGSASGLLTRPSSATAGVVPRKELEVYFFLPHARPVPVKVGLERNRSAMGKAVNSLVYPRPQQLTPLPCGGRARLDLSLEPRQSAVLISGLATGPPAGVGGGLGPFLAV